MPTPVVEKIHVSGNLSNLNQAISGTLSSSNTITGTQSIPQVLDRTAIHYNYTSVWDSHPQTIAQEGHLYIYRDHEVIENPDGSTTEIPGIKVGDGTSYLIDMPFVATGGSEEFENHINNWSIHVSASDRTRWNQKVSVDVYDIEEEMIFSY